MSVENQPQRFAMLVGLLCVSFLAACATELTEDEQFALEYAAFERKESIRDFLYSCESSGRSVVYRGPTYNKLRDPVKHVPNHARLSDYVCTSSETVAREFGVGG